EVQDRDIIHTDDQGPGIAAWWCNYGVSLIETPTLPIPVMGHRSQKLSTAVDGRDIGILLQSSAQTRTNPVKVPHATTLPEQHIHEATLDLQASQGHLSDPPDGSAPTTKDDLKAFLADIHN
ncbi:Hypothetical predicted protein, partial [Pelobates cultripes]